MEPGPIPALFDEDVDAAEPGSGGPGDLIGRGVIGQIRLDGEQIGRLALLACAGGECPQRLTVAIDTGDPDASCQQAPRRRPADAPRRW
jgi:hypothetical protein